MCEQEPLPNDIRMKKRTKKKKRILSKFQTRNKNKIKIDEKSRLKFGQMTDRNSLFVTQYRSHAKEELELRK